MSLTGSPFSVESNEYTEAKSGILEEKFNLKYPNPSTPTPAPQPTPFSSDLKNRSTPMYSNALMNSHVPVLGNEDHICDEGEEAQIVVDLKKLGVNLDKDVGRSIQKNNASNDAAASNALEFDLHSADVRKSKLNPTAASWTPSVPKPRAIGQKPIAKPSVNMAPNFGRGAGGAIGSGNGRKTPPNVQKIEAGDGIYIQTKHKQTTLRSSRDQQNFPNIPPQKGQGEKLPNINPIVAQTIFQRNQTGM